MGLKKFNLAIRLSSVNELNKLELNLLDENCIIILEDLRGASLSYLEAISKRVRIYTAIDNPFIEIVKYKYIASEAEIADSDYDFYIADANRLDRISLSRLAAAATRPVIYEVASTSDIKALAGVMLDGILIDYIDKPTLEKARAELQKIAFNPAKYDLFVVDYDGTILDSMPMWRKLYKDFLDSENIKTDRDVFSMVTKLTNVEIIKLLHDEFMPNEEISVVADKFYSFLRVRYLECRAKPGASKLLSRLRGYGRVVLYSATAKALLAESLRALGLNQLFDEIYSGSDLNISKGDGSGYITILEMNKGYSRPLIVEDAMHAIAGAYSKGLDILAVYDRYNLNSFDEIIDKANYFINMNRE